MTYSTDTLNTYAGKQGATLDYNYKGGASITKSKAAKGRYAPPTRDYRDREFKCPDKVIKRWGVDDTRIRGVRHMSGFKIDGYRKDRRHGFQGEITEMSDYSKDILNSMFKGW